MAMDRGDKESAPNVNAEQEQKESSVESTNNPKGKSAQERINLLSGEGKVDVLKDDIGSSNFKEVNNLPESLLGEDLSEKAQFNVHGQQV